MSDVKKSLLIELGTEELPPKSLDDLGDSFLKAVQMNLLAASISFGDEAKFFCSPRRITVYIPRVASEQANRVEERRGPAVSAALDSTGQPTKALIGFAQSCGVDVTTLNKLETDKGAWFVYRAAKQGQPVGSLIPELVTKSLKALPIPKPMRWGDHDYAFVRPAHWLVMLYGDVVVEGEILGLKSGRQSRGHRFHHPQPVYIADADSWLDSLRAAKVLADPVERRRRVHAEVARTAKETGGVPRLSDALCDEIANLTEWPVAIACAFEREFLAVPQEALVMTMETNQKFVPVFDAGGKLTEHFIGVANIESKDPAEIRKGYERVIRPRFADAKFFWDEDLKTPLAANQEALKSVTYQQSLGSVWDKSVRVAELARVIANRVGVDAGLATRAAELSKCDLLTRMVGEFPELQGVMGRYYATANGENAEVAQALDEFYAPRFAGDKIAQGKVAQVLAVAERLDTLAGIFAVGMKPSGNKDPFALRRAALGLARTLIEGQVSLDLRAQLVEVAQLVLRALEATKVRDLSNAMAEAKRKGVNALTATTAYWEQDSDRLATDVYDFVLDRLRSYYADQGIAGEAFEAVRALAPSDLTDFDRRLRAVVEFAKLPQAQALAAANKRIGNILRQAGGEPGSRIDPALLDAGAEADLHRMVEAAAVAIAPLAAQGRYVETLQQLAGLREPVDKFFDAVMVMVDDTAKRANRLALLSRLRGMFLDVADISLLPGN